MSSSSSCAEDHSQVEYLPEKKALRVDFKVGSADDWPNFKLEDGEVFYKDGKTFANLLHTDIEGPFIVRGKLIVANDEVKERKCRKFCAFLHFLRHVNTGSSSQEVR